MINFVYKTRGKHGSGSGFNYPKVKDGFVWIHMTNPTDKEISEVKKRFNVKSSIFEKYIKEKKTIKYFFKPLSFAFIDYYYKKGKIMIEGVLYIVDKHYLITVSKEKLGHYDEVFNLIKEKIPKIKTTGHLLYEIIDYDVEENYDVLHLIENRISELEKKVLSEEDIKNKIKEVIDFKRELLFMWRRFWSSSKILFSIKKGMTPIEVDDELVRLFDDVHDSLIHQMDIVSTQREVLTDAITIYETVISNRFAKVSNKINENIKRLTWIMFIMTGVATVLTFPNTIATIFGIPEWPLSVSDWDLIAFLMIISMIIPTLWFYRYWKKHSAFV